MGIAVFVSDPDHRMADALHKIIHAVRVGVTTLHEAEIGIARIGREMDAPQKPGMIAAATSDARMTALRSMRVRRN